MTSARFLLRAVLVAAVCLAGCGKAKGKTLRLATTSSVADSGLLSALLPAFEKQSGLSVELAAVGSGPALVKVTSGEADVAISHAETAEQAMVADGRVASRTPFMRNDFVLVGPPSMAGTVAGSTDVAHALKRAAAAQLRFVSRGDDSGTHQREQALWKLAGVPVDAAFIRRVNAGMLATLERASIEGALTLSDRATFIANRQKLNLAILFQGGEDLANVYSLILPRGGTAGRVLVDYVKSPEGRTLIGAFGVTEHGESLFTPVE